MRKKLLSEAQVRRFQSLASIKPLNEMGTAYKKHDQEDKEEKMEEAYGDKAHMKNDAMEEDMAYQKEDEKMEALYEEEDDMDAMDEADVELDEELVEKFMEAAATIQEVADALGGAAGADMDLDDEDDMKDIGGDEPADDLDIGGDEPAGDDEDAMKLDEALSGINYVPSQKEIVKTVAKRVAKRLQEAKRAEARLNKALGKRR